VYEENKQRYEFNNQILEVHTDKQTKRDLGLNTLTVDDIQ